MNLFAERLGRGGIDFPPKNFLFFIKIKRDFVQEADWAVNWIEVLKGGGEDDAFFLHGRDCLDLFFFRPKKTDLLSCFHPLCL